VSRVATLAPAAGSEVALGREKTFSKSICHLPRQNRVRLSDVRRPEDHGDDGGLEQLRQLRQLQQQLPFLNNAFHMR